MSDKPKATLTDLEDIKVIETVQAQIDPKLLPWDMLVARLQPHERFFCHCKRGFTTEKGLRQHCQLKNSESHYPVADPLWARRLAKPEPTYYPRPVPSHDIRGRAITTEFILVTIPRRDGLPTDPVLVHPKTYAELRHTNPGDHGQPLARRVGRISKDVLRFQHTLKGWLLIPRGTPKLQNPTPRGVPK